jgi:replication fork clamp-binding protein CrfC
MVFSASPNTQSRQIACQRYDDFIQELIRSQKRNVISDFDRFLEFYYPIKGIVTDERQDC